VLLGTFIVAPRIVLAQTGQSALPPPPAIAIADRLVQAHNYPAAVQKLSQVTSSHTYKDTVWAPEALYKTARIEEDLLHNHTAAMSSYNSLINSQNYQALNYPDKPAAIVERKALMTKIDRLYSISGGWRGFEWRFIDFFVKLTGATSYSYWLALVLISVIVRLLLTPLTIKQYKSMREMQRLSPLLKELQAKYKGNKEVLGPKTMELYKEHGVNPAAGCVPLILQLPIFYFMYQCVFAYQYHFTAGTFLWIGSPLHARFPDLIAANLSQPDLVLLFLYSVSMYVTQRMMPQTDPTQAEMQKTTALMTSVFFFMFFQQYHYPSAFVLYWLISNLLSTATQLFFMRRGDSTPPNAIINLPSDGGDKGTGISNGSSNGSARSMRSVQGTARGVIAPKVYPKKKRR
jgi:YidC/Oxa1 family membrane protein insertase